MSDPIANFLTRVRNAGNAQHRYVDVPHSNMLQSIAEILKNCGLIENYLVKIEKPQGTMRVFLKYQGRRTVIQGIERVSKSGLRKYVGYKDIPYFYGGFGVSIVTTPQGVMSGNEAIKRKIGGELLCRVW